MSLEVPSTQDLSANIVASLEASLSQNAPLLPKAFLRVLAKAIAAVLVVLYKYAGFIFLQMFPAYATDRETNINGKIVRPLVEWGRLLGVGDPKTATRAELSIEVTVTNQTGTLEVGTQLTHADSEVIYEVVAPVDLNAPTVTATVRAFADPLGGSGYGTIGNRAPGDVLSFVNPIANVAQDAVVGSTIVQGAAAETTEAYRKRVFEQASANPQGGAYADYRSWGMEVPGIANIYPYTANTPGVVDVYVEAVQAPPLDGIPTQAQLDAVAYAINYDDAGQATRRPANAAVEVKSITRLGVDLTISGLTPDTTALRDAIRNAVDEYLRSREPFILGLSVLPREDRITEAAVTGVVEQVVSSSGGAVSSVSMGSPSIALGHGQKAKVGVIQWL